MGWIKPEDKMPPSGLTVLLEVSGYWTDGLISDHDFEIGCWLGNPDGNREPFWVIHGAVEYCGKYHELTNPTVHAWMPLPEHFQPQEMFGEPEDDLMEHAMFEDDPEWLYKGDCKYEGLLKMDIWVKDLKTGDKWILDRDKNKIVYLDGTQTVFNMNDVGRIRFYPCDPDAESEYQQLSLFDFIENGGELV